MFRKIAKFLFETVFGPFVFWCVAAGMFFASIILASPLGKFGAALGVIALVALAAMSLVAVAAFILALVRRRWKRAAGQFFLGIVGVVLFGIGLTVSWMAAAVFAYATSSGGSQAQTAELSDGDSSSLAFKVEFRSAHPFLAEYSKCIVFPSGKRVGIYMDTGGAGPFAVYRLPTGEYYLVDGLKHDFVRSDYRVNVTNETVETMVGGNDPEWIKIPDGSLDIVGRWSGSITVKMKSGETEVSGGTPVGDSLTGRKYLGLLHPDGRFEAGDGDPYADVVEPKWIAVKLEGGEVPFSLECRRWKGSHHYRLAFASGNRFMIGSANCLDDGGYSIHLLKDGLYYLSHVRNNNSVSFLNDWRFDAQGESVEVMFKDHWRKFGDLWVKIPPGANPVGGIGIRGGENGRPLWVSLNTKKGKVEVHDVIPVGNSISNATFIGTFHALP